MFGRNDADSGEKHWTFCWCTSTNVTMTMICSNGFIGIVCLKNVYDLIVVLCKKFQLNQEAGDGIVLKIYLALNISIHHSSLITPNYT